MMLMLWCILGLRSVQAEVLQKPILEGEPLRVALLIGLDGQIGGSGDLTSAESGVETLGETLSAQGFQVVMMLRGEDASRDEITQAFQTIGGLGLTEEDLLMVYIATHGATCPAVDRNGTHYLRLQETVPGSGCWERAFTDGELLEGLQASGAGLRLLMMEACMTAVGTMGSGIRPSADPWSGRNLDEVILRSTSPGQFAYQLGGQLLYTTAFRAGLETMEADLDGDGAVSALEAHDYASIQVAMRRPDQLPMRQHSSVGRSREIILAGTPDEPTRSIFYGMVPIGAFGFGGVPVSLGPSGSLPVAAPGPMVRWDRLGVSSRVHGVPNTPRALDGGAWLVGRARGLPSAVLYGSLSPLDGTGGAALRLRAPIFSALTLSGEGGVTGEHLTGHVIVSTNLHWRQWTVEAGGRAGTAFDGAVRARSLGGEVGVRTGLSESIAISWLLTHDRTEENAITGIRAGLLWDPAPGIARARMTSIPLDERSRSWRLPILAGATTSALLSAASYTMARQVHQDFYATQTSSTELDALRRRTNRLYGLSISTGGLALGMTGAVFLLP